jgi:hypothetical protein
MRNALIHGYDSVNAVTVWNTVHNDLPILKRQMAALLRAQRDRCALGKGLRFSEFQYIISACLSGIVSCPLVLAATFAAAVAPLQRLAAPPADEADGAPHPPPLTQVLEKKQNREVNELESS